MDIMAAELTAGVARILAEGAPMPRHQDLPDSLAKLVRHNAVRLRSMPIALSRASKPDRSAVVLSSVGIGSAGAMPTSPLLPPGLAIVTRCEGLPQWQHLDALILVEENLLSSATEGSMRG
jgi:hypothetical protein